MGIINYKSTTPSRRNMSVLDYKGLDKVRPESRLTSSLSKKAGRNNTGRITVRHRGGGAKRSYRIIDFKRDKLDVSARVEYIEYDPNRTCFIARLVYQDGERRYIIHPEGVKKGDVLISSKDADIKPGNTLPLKNIPVGMTVHNISITVL